jgi:hypothetical protein
VAFSASGQFSPKNWNDMSMDYRLLSVYLGFVMLLAMGGGDRLSFSGFLILTGLLVVVLIAISRRHRKRNHWQWPGGNARTLTDAAVTFVPIASLLFAATPQFPVRAVLPCYLVGLGIGAFSVLEVLRIVSMSKAEFWMDCYFFDPSGQKIARVSRLPEAKPPVESTGKKWIHRSFRTLFLLWWIGAVAFFYYDGVTLQHGLPSPTATRTERLDNHGRDVFVTPAEKRRIDEVPLVLAAAIVSLMLSGAVMHFLFGVKVFSGAPKLREYSDRKRAGT